MSTSSGDALCRVVSWDAFLYKVNDDCTHVLNACVLQRALRRSTCCSECSNASQMPICVDLCRCGGVRASCAKCCVALVCVRSVETAATDGPVRACVVLRVVCTMCVMLVTAARSRSSACRCVAARRLTHCCQVRAL
jgi:hypothetical protein